MDRFGNEPVSSGIKAAKNAVRLALLIVWLGCLAIAAIYVYSRFSGERSFEATRRGSGQEYMKTHVIVALMLMGGFWTHARLATAQSTNAMPDGFQSVHIGMTSNELLQARANVEWPEGSFPGNEASEVLTNRTFFDSVGYDFFATNGLAVVYFYPLLDESDKRLVTAGFVKGCLQKYGTNYEMRVANGPSSRGDPLAKVALLRWTNLNAVVVATFISEPNRQAFRGAGGTEIRALPYKLRIYGPSAININGGTNNLDDITASYPASQDTTGQAFTNFPAFLNSYSGPIWE